MPIRKKAKQRPAASAAAKRAGRSRESVAKSPSRIPAQLGLSDAQFAYQQSILRFRELAERAMPADATAIIVSKGDEELLKLNGRRAWHFPQREDGIYAGYYPGDSAAAIAHLETLREKGGQFIAFPASAFWWLEHYAGLRQHLESHYKLVAQDEHGVIFALCESAAASAGALHLGANGAPHPANPDDPLCRYIDAQGVEDLRLLFDADHYSEHAGSFASSDEALIHYLEQGYRAGHSPHVLFDVAFYFRQYPEVKASGKNPLLHFLSNSVAGGHDPNPYFDTEFYYKQGPDLREHRMNALAHYLRYAADGKCYRPNPVFSDGYYLSMYPEVKRGRWNPLTHYIQHGRVEGKLTSHVHKDLANGLLRPAATCLRRGMWKSGAVALFSSGTHPESVSALLAVARVLSDQHRMKCLTVFHKRPELPVDVADYANVIVLEDVSIACDIFRPSAMRMLVGTIEQAKPLFALSDGPEALDSLQLHGIPAFCLCPAEDEPIASEQLHEIFNRAGRIIVRRSADFHAVARAAGTYPANVALRPLDPQAPEAFVASLLRLATRDFAVQPEAYLPKETRTTAKTTRKIVVPCCDWGLSGVNTALETMGQELIRLGWDLEIVFTKDSQAISRSAGSETLLPRLPHRYLPMGNGTTEARWENLISYLENSTPCIMFMGYDFLANAIAPALTEKVGVVAWVQSDDGDYYEQAYRLGRYCNALVCVSDRIRAGVTELNPVIGQRATVIHNSSIWESEIAKSAHARSRKMKLVYTGRLVQYQKRILDFAELAKALDAAAVPYELTLVGEFVSHDGCRDPFLQLAQSHLEDGRIRLAGRLEREQVLKTLAKNDFFVLLSDFEGLPLSLVEAMACGCVPIVAEMQSGIPEAITSGENGLIVRGRDYSQWATALVKLWKDQATFASMSKKAREVVRQQFTIEHVARQFDALFKRVADEICSSNYHRPPSLHWGPKRSIAGDVLPPPAMYKPSV